MKPEKFNFHLDTVINSKSNFADLAYALDFDPVHDFQNIDLTGVDFSDSDLSEFRFAGSTLDGSDLRKARVSSHTLAGVVSMQGAKLPPDAEGSVTVTMALPLAIIKAARNDFGSLRRASILAIEASSRVSVEDLDEMIFDFGDLGMLDRTYNEDRAGNKIPRSLYDRLSRISSHLGYGRPTVLKSLLYAVNRSAVLPATEQLNSHATIDRLFNEARLISRL